MRAAIEEKFFAALRIAQALAPQVNDGGSITVTAGAGGRPHSASGAIVGNAAIRLLAEGLAAELAPRVRANAIAPTWTDTPLWRALPREDVEATKAHFATLIPLGRTATVGRSGLSVRHDQRLHDRADLVHRRRPRPRQLTAGARSTIPSSVPRGTEFEAS